MKHFIGNIILRGAGDSLTWKRYWFLGLLISWFVGFLVVAFVESGIQSFKYHDPLGGTLFWSENRDSKRYVPDGGRQSTKNHNK